MCGEGGGERVCVWGGGEGPLYRLLGASFGDEHSQRLVLDTHYQLMPRISCADLGVATGQVDPHQLSHLTSARVPLINETYLP